jgi:hypothetical protein
LIALLSALDIGSERWRLGSRNAKGASGPMRQAKENAKLILGWGNAGVQSMCDYSLHSVKSRPAKSVTG